MRTLRTATVFALLIAGCSKVAIAPEGRPCKDGACLDGWACHPISLICVPALTVDCSGSGLCPSGVETGDRCDSPGSFIPCGDDGVACDDGCRTCQASGTWGECSGLCDPSHATKEACDGVDNDCDGKTDEADALGCTAYYLDADGDTAGRDSDTVCLCAPEGAYTATAGGDCNDDDRNNWVSCASCADDDGDEWYSGCDAYETLTGPDCDDGKRFVWNDCDKCRDDDHDGAVAGCGVPEARDCNDGNPNNWVSCTSCADADGDGWYAGCDAYVSLEGPDCDDDPLSCGGLCEPSRDELCNDVDHNCDGDPWAGCRRIVPTNLNDVDLCTSSADVTLTGGVTFNTADGAISTSLETEPDFTRTQQDGGAGPEVGVWTFGRLHIAADATITFVGGPAAVILACDEIVVDGTVSVCASGRSAGPGGYNGGTASNIGNVGEGPGGGLRGERDDDRYGGGGGGGYCGGGGPGGSAGGAGTGGASGPANGNFALSPLEGGSGGASSRHVTSDGGREGGGGGGAIELVAGRRVVINGLITACGAAGAGTGSRDSSGAGAGAGGAILVEAPLVAVSQTAALAANGGGGSGGAVDSSGNTIGEDGRSDALQAAGGTGRGGGGGGGLGGAGTTLSGGRGADNDWSSGRGGGGGGAAGRIRINSLGGSHASVDPGALFSPVEETGCVTTGELALE